MYQRAITSYLEGHKKCTNILSRRIPKEIIPKRYYILLRRAKHYMQLCVVKTIKFKRINTCTFVILTSCSERLNTTASCCQNYTQKRKTLQLPTTKTIKSKKINIRTYAISISCLEGPNTRASHCQNIATKL